MSSFQKNQIALAVNANAQAMSSRDLLDLINSARLQNGEPEIRLNKFNEKIEDELEGDYYTKSVVQNSNNTESVIYQLTKDQCLLISMRESKSVRRTVLAKLNAIPQTLPEALRLAADLAEQKAVLEAKVQADAPKVQFHDQVTEAINCQTVEEVAKVLGTGKIRMFRWLRQEGFLMSDNNPYQSYLDRGYFRVIEAQYNDKKRGESHTYTKTLITGKGLAFIQKRFMQEAA